MIDHSDDERPFAQIDEPDLTALVDGNDLTWVDEFPLTISHFEALESMMRKHRAKLGQAHAKRLEAMIDREKRRLALPRRSPKA
jgi:hypothetical protein